MDQYLRKLRKSLGFNFNHNDTEEIIAEYKSFFEDGLKEGKTEEELCLDFGEPKEVVSFLRKENKRPLIPRKVVAGIVFGGLLLLLMAFTKHLIVERNVYYLVLTSLLWFLLWFLLGGSWYSLISYSKSIKFSRKISILSFAPLVIAILATLYHTIVIGQALGGVFPSPFQLKFVLYGSVVLLLALVVGSIIGFFNGNPYYYGVVCHAGGGLYSAICVVWFYSNWSDVEALLGTVVLTGIPYVIGGLISLIFNVFIFMKKERES